MSKTNFRSFKALQKGDSGSIVVDARSRAFYGIVTATTPLGDIYVAPFTTILDQIKKLLETEDVVLLMPLSEQEIGRQRAPILEVASAVKEQSIQKISDSQMASPPRPSSQDVSQQSSNKSDRYIEDAAKQPISSGNTQTVNVKATPAGGSSNQSKGRSSHSQTKTETQPQIQPCRYKVGKTLGAGSYSVVKECVHIDTGKYYAAKVINKKLMAGRQHMVGLRFRFDF
jgi:hypothetical protein